MNCAVKRIKVRKGEMTLNHTAQDYRHMCHGTNKMNVVLGHDAVPWMPPVSQNILSYERNENERK